MSTTTANKPNTNSNSKPENSATDPMYAQRAASFAHETVDKLASTASAAEKNLRNTAGLSADAVKARGEQVKHEFESASAQTRAFIAKHPYASAGIAFGAGMLITAFLRRRNTSA